MRQLPPRRPVLWVLPSHMPLVPGHPPSLDFLHLSELLPGLAGFRRPPLQAWQRPFPALVPPPTGSLYPAPPGFGPFPSVLLSIWSLGVPPFSFP